MVKCKDGAYVDAEEHDEVVEYLRKSAESSPPQSPHDGIHTCSKGCSKPGCNRALRDTIDEQNIQIEALKRDLLEATADKRKKAMETIHDINQIGGLQEENARLKAEVERLTAEPDALTAYLYADTLRRDDIKTLKAHIKRLTKAGDELWEFAKLADTNAPKARRKALKDWHAAKKGKQP
jgi:chromosome segregation ATPase